MTLLAEGVPRIFRAGWAMIVERDGDRSFRLAESAAAPETREGDLHWLPLKRAVVIDPALHWVPDPWTELDTELAAAPFGRPAGAGRRPPGRAGVPAVRAGPTDPSGRYRRHRAGAGQG